MEDFRIVESGITWSEERQSWLRYNVCEELVDGRWEGFVSVQPADIQPS
jgi:hypothetical protein